MKKMLRTFAMASIVVVFSTSASADYIGSTNEMVKANYYLASSDLNAKLADIGLFVGVVIPSALYVAYRDAYYAKVKAYAAWLNAPIGSRTERYARDAFDLLDVLDDLRFSLFITETFNSNTVGNADAAAYLANVAIGNSMANGSRRR